MTVRIANASAFWGDRPDAAATLLEQDPDIDYITFDYLAELSLSIMAAQRERDPTAGYARDFVDVVVSLAPFWKNGLRFKAVTNAGGLNPKACAEACRQVLREAGCEPIKVAVVTGDDVLSILLESPQEKVFNDLETGSSLEQVSQQLVTANAYLGADAVAEALRAGAHLVITGRVADPSLTVAPCMAHFNWQETDCDKIAGATVAGHLIECGTQVTGGIVTDWLEVTHPEILGFPIVEVSEDGSCVVTKPKKSGGRVDERTVKEQLLYELGDPARYLSPDASVSFLSLKVEKIGEDRVRVSGAKGQPPTPTYKVSACYRDGFRAEAMIVLVGRDIVQKGQRCGAMVLERLRDAGYEVERSCVECLGAGDVVPGIFPVPENLHEIVLRLCVADPRREAIEHFTKEIAPLVTSGPQGITGYASGRPKVRSVFGYWPCLIERSRVHAKWEMVP